MCGIQSKVIRHAKRQENMTHDAEDNQSTEVNPDLTQTLELVKKDIVSYCCSVPHAKKVNSDTEGIFKRHKLKYWR